MPLCMINYSEAMCIPSLYVFIFKMFFHDLFLLLLFFGGGGGGQGYGAIDTRYADDS